MGWCIRPQAKSTASTLQSLNKECKGHLGTSQYLWLRESLPNPQKDRDRKGEREVDGYRDMLLEQMGYLLLRHSKCPPGLLAAVPAAGPSHASTYSPLETTASSTASHPAPAASAATAMVPARPISAAATITPRPAGAPIRGELCQLGARLLRPANQHRPPANGPIGRDRRLLLGTNPQRRPGRAPRQQALSQTKSAVRLRPPP